MCFTNDLFDTLDERVLDSAYEVAAKYCHGLATIHQWTGEESMNPKKIRVPPPVAAYNTFINGVDRVDQLEHQTQSNVAKEGVDAHLYMAS